jgi:PIN domain nuclease of toxin-antitoxin system
MILLLDSHIFIWWANSSKEISPATINVLEDNSNTLFLSLVSIWEMQIKHQLGRLKFSTNLFDIVEMHKTKNNLHILPITEEHIYHLNNLPHHHTDPFDRLIIAQSLSENLTLVSDDAIFPKYGVNLL